MQLPLALKETGRPEDAVALTLKSGFPYLLSASGSKVIVWLNLSVLAVAVALAAETLPAASTALTVYEYVVPALSPVLW